MKTVDLNGIGLAYERRGKGTPLVLIHGYPLDHTIWNEMLPMLEDAFDVILPDLRGFGGSTTIHDPYSVDEMASDVAALLDHLGIENAAVVGHSMGGYVALAFARLYPTHIRGLGLISSQAAADTPERSKGRYDTAEQVAEKGVGVATDGMAAKLSADARVQAFAQDLIERQSAPGVIGALKAMAARQEAISLLRLLDYAIVIVHGDADMLIPVDRAREMKDAVLHANYVELPGVGHLPMIESAEKTADALKGFK